MHAEACIFDRNHHIFHKAIRHQSLIAVMIEWAIMAGLAL